MSEDSGPEGIDNIGEEWRRWSEVREELPKVLRGMKGTFTLDDVQRRMKELMKEKERRDG